MSTAATETLSTVASSSHKTIASRPSVYGKVNYVPANTVPTPSPYNLHLPSISAFSDSRIVPLHDLRPLPTLSDLTTTTTNKNAIHHHASLSTHNFTALAHPSQLHSPPHTLTSWLDPTLLQSIYIPETEALLKALTGARTITTSSLLLRSVPWSEEDALASHGTAPSTTSISATTTTISPSSIPYDTTQHACSFPQFIGFPSPNTAPGAKPAGGASPAPKAHQDYTPAGARAHIRHYHPLQRAAASAIIAAEDSSTPVPAPPRWALFSVWRPLKRVRRDALALCDPRTLRDEDYVPVMIRTPSLGAEGSGDESGIQGWHECEAWVARAGAGDEGGGVAHKWYWVSEQEPEEVLVIGLFDSAREGDGSGKGAGGTMHCSVELVGAGGQEGVVEARESLELRCLAVW